MNGYTYLESKIQEITPRIKVTAADITEVSKIKIMYPNENSLSHEFILYENPQDFANKIKTNLDLLWRCSLLCEKTTPIMVWIYARHTHRSTLWLINCNVFTHDRLNLPVSYQH